MFQLPEASLKKIMSTTLLGLGFGGFGFFWLWMTFGFSGFCRFWLWMVSGFCGFGFWRLLTVAASVALPTLDFWWPST